MLIVVALAFGKSRVALGEFGKNAKSFVDKIREIAEIAWRTQALA